MNHDTTPTPEARAWLAATKRAGRYQDTAIKTAIVAAVTIAAGPATFLVGYPTASRWLLISAATAAAITQILVVLASRHLPDSRTTARMPAHLTALAAVATALAVAMLVTGTLTTSWWWMPPFLMASTAAMAAATADKW